MVVVLGCRPDYFRMAEVARLCRWTMADCFLDVDHSYLAEFGLVVHRWNYPYLDHCLAARHLKVAGQE